MSKVIIDQISDSIPEYFDGIQFSQIGILVDENTKAHCLPLISNLVPIDLTVEIKSGESNKNLDTCSTIWNELTNAQFDRNSVLINLGGGVIGDMGGFCASTFKRGIRFINIPTTLLANVDASVGGKLGIDFNGFKNHIGLFKEPETVLIDPIFLDTLPEKQLRSGFAEVLKHGLIADKDYFQQVSAEGLTPQNWNSVIAHSVHIKNEVVSADPTEKGLRKILNFGHTIGHAIESHYLETENELLHGEAIAIGMISEAYLSKKLLNLSDTDLDLVIQTLTGIYSKVELSKKDFPEIVRRAYQDKKNSGGTLNFSLIKTIGNAVYDIEISENDIIDALFYYTKLEY